MLSPVPMASKRTCMCPRTPSAPNLSPYAVRKLMANNAQRKMASAKWARPRPRPRPSNVSISGRPVSPFSVQSFDFQHINPLGHGDVQCDAAVWRCYMPSDAFAGAKGVIITTLKQKPRLRQRTSEAVACERLSSARKLNARPPSPVRTAPLSPLPPMLVEGPRTGARPAPSRWPRQPR